MQTWDYRDTATYWAVTGHDRYGAPQFAAPVELEVRWEHRMERFINGEGKEVLSRAVVFIKQSVDVGDFIYFGSSAATDPTQVATAFEIQQVIETPDLQGLFTERRIYL